MTVLGWTRSDARNFKPFVAHRVSEIIETTNIEKWHWVPTELNVADDATRGKCKALTIESRWVTGPRFLLSPPSEWPTESQTLPNHSVEAELKPSCRHPSSKSFPEFSSSPIPYSIETILFNHTHQLPSPVAVEAANISSWIKLLKASALVHFFIAKIFRNCHRCFQNPLIGDIVNNISNARSPNTPATLSYIDAQAMQRAECHVLLKSQLACFNEEMISMVRHQPIPKKSRLATLSPELDSRGLIRLAGRIAATPGIDEDLKRPVILDSKDPAVRLLIQHYHCKYAHANTETVLNELRQRYWILGIRNATRAIVRRCQMCKLLRAPTMQPPMGDLPVNRLEHSKRPFSNTGLDYFGPVLVSVGRRREKRWIALFTCLVTRAVHLEVAHSLSTDSAIMCLRRFVARRGNPTTIFSDNGTAFKGASRQLRSLYGNDVYGFAATNGIIWHFIPPSAPFMGGAWERLVKSIKVALNATLRHRTPSDEILNTVLVEAEAIVNTRPLTHVSPDPDHPEALTPNHFLLGESSRRCVLDNVELSDADLCGRSNWRKAMRLADHYWSRWVREYLPSLAPRRVPGSAVSIKIGDLVLIGDGDLPRSTWPRGVVEALHPGRDGVTRVVDIRTQAGILRRPLKKLVLL
jgi:transposase InsO family protein